MRNPTNHIFIGILALVTLVMISSCGKDYYVLPDIEITEPVSFSQEVLPIFDASCNMSGCHNTGGIAPDLTAQNAYNNLYLYNLVDTLNPELSVLYLEMNATSNPMPPSGNLDPFEIATVLAWIKQGGKDD